MRFLRLPGFELAPKISNYLNLRKLFDESKAFRNPMTHTRDDVLAAVRFTFQDRDLATILAVLDLYGTESYEPEKERVQLAIAELSRGSMDELRYLVQCAKTDYRDVLAWKQLGSISEGEGEKLQNEASTIIEKWGKK
jgi:hypothetical protein